MKFAGWAVVCASALTLAGCNTTQTASYSGALPAESKLSVIDPKFVAMVPNPDLPQVFRRATVDYSGGEAPGTIIIDTKEHHLFFVLPGKKAVRYGVATGNEAQGWTGVAYVNRKAEWPRWIPPADMLSRWPHLKPTGDAGGLPGGPDNPLGARALYLYQGNRDTLYRIHGTNEPEMIGQDVSSGCIRLTNLDVIDLYGRVTPGAKVIVR